MKSFLLLLALVLTVHYAHGYPLKPDVRVSPGHMCTTSDSDFETFRYAQRIPYCTRNVSYQTKQEIYDYYKIPQAERKNYTIDHIIPLSIGGSNNKKNLWAEHKQVKATRPNLEVELYEDVRDNRMEQREAIRIIMEEKFKN